MGSTARVRASDVIVLHITHAWLNVRTMQVIEELRKVSSGSGTEISCDLGTSDPVRIAAFNL